MRQDPAKPAAVQAPCRRRGGHVEGWPRQRRSAVPV